MDVKRIFWVLLCFCFICLVTSCATTTTPLRDNKISLSGVPLPENIKIIVPDPALPAEIRAFSGRWSGTWSNSCGSLKVVLIVKEINNQEARVIYAWGDEPNWFIQAGYGKYIARVNGWEIKFYGGTSTFTFKMQKSLDKLRGYARSLDYSSMTTMRKVD